MTQARRALSRLVRPKVAFGVAVIFGVVACLVVAFHLFGGSYWTWYLGVAPQASASFAVYSLVIGLDRRVNLLSADPYEFVMAVLEVLALASVTTANSFRARRADVWLDGTPEGRVAMSWRRSTTLDMAASVLVNAGLSVALLVWAVFVAPLQYVVLLVAAAPIREALAADPATRDDVSLDEAPYIACTKSEPRSWLDGTSTGPLSFAGAPVTVAFGIASLLLWLLQRVPGM